MSHRWAASPAVVVPAHYCRGSFGSIRNQIRLRAKSRKKSKRVAAIDGTCLALNLQVPVHVVASGMDLYRRQSPMRLLRIQPCANPKCTDIF
ncbi:hypothetical protein E2C01_040717 [Portunus trituberculatus]|uniref:Uncharacterized protein n=1 Tax=Portunus trituberculatus TaxID=210409 RepID=A0A5B7FPI4_PORTR|nr:hypothetical protein [Portunus trituberculatus]